MKFTRDPRKAASNRKKHGVSVQEGATVFGDPLALAVEDDLDPKRGMSERLRVLVVVHVELADETIRPISARRATSDERRRHEEDR